MSRAILGDTIDIHTGGEDNIFPHHECEIAQSESVTGKLFVKTWLHKRRIDLEGEKMSKSLGNVVTIADILQRGYEPADLRFYLLSVHYRTNLKFTWKGMDDAKDARRKIADAFAKVDARVEGGGVSGEKDLVAVDIARETQAFRDALDSDLNAPAALATMFAVTKLINSLEATQGAYSDVDLGALRTFVDLARRTFGCFDRIADVQIPHDVQQLLDLRAASRTAKNFAESDRLRGEIEKRGFTLMDTGSGQSLRKT
jgi:cysteinyl-tRNA synthetase